LGGVLVGWANWYILFHVFNGGGGRGGGSYEDQRAM